MEDPSVGQTTAPLRPRVVKDDFNGDVQPLLRVQTQLRHLLQQFGEVGEGHLIQDGLEVPHHLHLLSPQLSLSSWFLVVHFGSILDNYLPLVPRQEFTF